MNGKQLKNSILQWAIQGKLVPQDPNDEPASVLLDRIREEKARLVKEKKIKKDKNESIIFRGDDNSHYEKFADGTVKCIDDEIPFEIPQSWCWARMSSVLDVRDGTHDTPNYVQSGYPLITGKDFYNGYFDLSKTQYISASDFEIICQRSKVDVGDILFSMIGGNIGSQILITEENYFEMAIKNVALFKHYSKGLINESYLSYFLQSRVYDFRAIASGGAQSFVSLKQLRNYLIPIPSLSEQNHIVSKIEEIMPIADKYEKSQEVLNKLNTEIFDKLKKTVLQEAIQGKLVPQDPNDEPASVLLVRIKEEKTKLFKEGKLKKKDLVDSVIFKGEDNKYYEKIGSQVTCIDDEIPFEIPNSWAWIRLGNIFQHNTGKALNGSNQKGVFYDYITTSNLYWNSFVLGKLRSMPFTDDELDKCTVKKGDLLVCEGGDIGRSAIWNYDYDIRIQNHIHRLRAYTPICTMFVYYTLYLYKHTGLIGGKGIGIQGLSSNALHKLLLPLPSIAEQKRIVDKIEFVIASITRR